MDALTIVYDLLHKDIIAPGDLKGIHTTDNPTLQNKILHNCLTVKCTKEALMTVCKIIIAVEGNPKMKALGRDMQSMLGGKIISVLSVVGSVLARKCMHVWTI